MKRLLLALALASATSACAGGGPPEVGMVASQAFDPEEITVSAGETISFKNSSSEAHTVTAYADEIPGGADFFSSGGLPSEEAARDELPAALVAAGDTYEVTLQEPGTYRYFCIPHEGSGMKGSIVVEV